MKKFPKAPAADKEVFDLSSLNFFETVQTIVSLSSSGIFTAAERPLKIKTPIPNLQNFIEKLPISGNIEYV